MTTLNGNLTLTFVDGKDLIRKDLLAQDPYCKVRIGGGSEGLKEGLKCLLSGDIGGVFKDVGGDQWKTKTHKLGGKNPHWNESHTFVLKDVKPDTLVQVHLMDEDLGPDDSIGIAQIPISEFLENQTKGKHYYQLVEKGDKRKIAGYVGITAKYEGSGPSVWETKGGQQTSYVNTYPGSQLGQPQQGWQQQPSPTPAFQSYSQQQGGWQGPQQGGWQQGGWQGPQQGWQGPQQGYQQGYQQGPQQGYQQGPPQGWQPQQSYGSGPTPAFQSYSKDVSSGSSSSASTQSSDKFTIS